MPHALPLNLHSCLLTIQSSSSDFISSELQSATESNSHVPFEFCRLLAFLLSGPDLSSSCTLASTLLESSFGGKADFLTPDANKSLAYCDGTDY